MCELVFNLQRFADDGGGNSDDTLTAEENEAIRKSSLPHLRLLSTIAKNPTFEKLTDVLEKGEDTVNFLRTL